MVWKKDLTPLKSGGRIDRHAGKGESIQKLTSGNSNPNARSINDYAKSTPMAQPSADWPDPFREAM